MAVTKDSYFIGVYQQLSKGRVNIPCARLTGVVLAKVGCEDIDCQQAGTASARIPDQWERDVEIDGGKRELVTINNQTFVVDVDLP